MKRPLIALAAGLALLAVACGSGDKRAASPAVAPTEHAAADTAAPAETVVAGNAATPSASTKSEKAISGLFESIFSGGLNGPQGQAPSGLGEGDPALLKYLPPNSALPDGYTPAGQYTLRAPDGISETGGINIAAEIAMAGDATASSPDFSKLGVLMALVMKPDDLQSLGAAFDSIKSFDQQQLEDALTTGTGTNGLFTIQNVKVFQTDGLGDGNVGMQMTIDLGAFGSLFSALSGTATPDPGAPDLSNLKLTMRLYLFARGNYAGGLLRMAFTDSLADDVDEVGLAKLIDDALKSAP
jgi:hypothetical protein